MQTSLTFMVCSYTVMRSKGFRMTPMSAKKLPALGGLLLVGGLGWYMGSTVSTALLGNSANYYYLLKNRSAIVSGAKSFDKPVMQ